MWRAVGNYKTYRIKNMTKKIKAAIFAAAFISLGGAAYTYDRYGVQDNSMILANIEALSQDADGDDDGGDNQAGDSETQRRRQECFSNNGQWGYASIYQGCKEVKVSVKGTCTWNGKEYSLGLDWNKSKSAKRATLSEYKCVADPAGIPSADKNCCTKQGIYCGDTKVG